MTYTAKDISRIRDEVREYIKPSRFEHTLGVAYTSACLAFIYNVDPIQAEVAGLLHDCAKGYDGEKLIHLCKKAGIALAPDVLASPQVIHAIYGKYMARHVFGIEDEEILDAICYHTTGRENMSTLEKIVFTADYIEPLRDQAPRLEELRKLAFRDIDECVYQILLDTVEYLGNKHVDIVTDTMKAFQWYKREREFR